MEHEHMTEDVMYSALPEHVLLEGKKLGLNKEVKSKQLLSAFLQRYVNRRKIEEGVEDVVRQAKFSLDNIRTRRKKVNKRKSKRKTLSRKELKKLTKLTSDNAVYDLYLPMHNLWNDYISDLIKFESLGGKNLAEAARRLMNADLHGAILHVTKSKCPSLVGTSGILLQETKNSFVLVTVNDRLKTIPKQNTVFTLQVHGYHFTIYGNNFRQRASERCIGSFKSHKSTEL